MFQGGCKQGCVRSCLVRYWVFDPTAQQAAPLLPKKKQQPRLVAARLAAP